MSRIPVNIPNVLTMFRFALIPAATVLIYFDYMVPAMTVYITACATDLLDGFLARRLHMTTSEGALLDPLADKLMAIFAIISFTVTGVFKTADGHDYGLLILLILLIKELLMIGGGIFLYFKGIVSPSNTFGKIAAFTLNTSIAFTFLHKFVSPWHIYFVLFALLSMIAALFQYAYFNMYRKLKARKQS